MLDIMLCYVRILCYFKFKMHPSFEKESSVKNFCKQIHFTPHKIYNCINKTIRSSGKAISKALEEWKIPGIKDEP